MSWSVDELRAELLRLLDGWSSGQLSTGEVHLLAERHMEDYDWREVPESDPTSIVNEALIQLDTLNAPGKEADVGRVLGWD